MASRENKRTSDAPHQACEGRVAVFVIAFLLAFGLCGGAFWFLTQADRQLTPAARPADTTLASTERAPASSTANRNTSGSTTSAAPTSAGDRTTARETDTTPAASAPPADTKPLSAEPETVAAIVSGKVVEAGEGGQPIAGATVYWTNPDPELPISFDPGMFETEFDTTLLPARTAALLASSRTARTGEDGRYEIAVPIVGGSLTAHAPGHATRESDVTSEAPGDGAGDENAGSDDKRSRSRMMKRRDKVQAHAQPKPASHEPARITIDFTLPVGGSVSGRVTDAATGAPAAGVLVAAWEDRPTEGGGAAFLRLAGGSENGPAGIVRADGTYHITGIEPGNYTIQPRTGNSSYLPTPRKAARTVTVLGGQEVSAIDFAVHAGGTIFGVVTDEQNQPVSGARVMASPKVTMMDFANLDSVVSMMEQFSRSDDEGQYRVSGLPLDAEYKVSASSDSHAAAEANGVTIPEAAGEVEVNLMLTAGSTVSGRAVEPDGAAAAGVNVMLMPDMTLLMSEGFSVMNTAGDNSAMTDDDGVFTIEHVRAGKYTLHSAGDFGEGFNPFGAKGTEIDVDGLHDVSGLELVVKADADSTGASVTIAGRVADADGAPIAGASVEVSARRGFNSKRAHATTDDAGKFTAEIAAEGPFTVEASKTGYQEATLNGVEAGERAAVLTLHARGGISGRVVTAGGGRPPAGFKVAVRELSSGMSGGFASINIQLGDSMDWTAGAADGSFQLDDVPLGRVEVVASVPGFATGRSEPIQVEAGASYSGIEIAVVVGATLTGKVKADGAPLAGANVSVSRASEDDSMNLIARMMPGMFGGEGNGNATTDHEGAFAVEHLAPGKYVVNITHPEYAPSHPEDITIEDDRDVSLSPVTLERGGIINGFVRHGEEKTPQAGVMVQIMGKDVPFKMATTKDDGAFHFEGLTAGEYTVVASVFQEGGQGKTQTVIVNNGDEVAVDFLLGVGSRVHGKFLGRTEGNMYMVQLRRPGSPAPEEIPLTNLNDLMESGKHVVAQSMVLEDTYTINDVEPGKYIIEVPAMPDDPTDISAYLTLDRTPYFRREIEVREGSALEIDIEVAPR